MTLISSIYFLSVVCFLFFCLRRILSGKIDHLSVTIPVLYFYYIQAPLVFVNTTQVGLNLPKSLLDNFSPSVEPYQLFSIFFTLSYTMLSIFIFNNSRLTLLYLFSPCIPQIRRSHIYQSSLIVSSTICAFSSVFYLYEIFQSGAAFNRSLTAGLIALNDPIIASLDSSFRYIFLSFLPIEAISLFVLKTPLKKSLSLNIFFFSVALNFLVALLLLSRSSFFQPLLVTFVELFSAYSITHSKRLKQWILSLSFTCLVFGAIRPILALLRGEPRSILVTVSDIFGEGIQTFVGSSFALSTPICSHLNTENIFGSFLVGSLPPFIPKLISVSVTDYAMTYDKYLRSFFNIKGYAFTPTIFSCGDNFSYLFVVLAPFISLTCLFLLNRIIRKSSIGLILFSVYLCSLTVYFRWDPMFIFYILPRTLSVLIIVAACALPFANKVKFT